MSKKTTTDAKPLYLTVTETRENGYYHLRAQVATQTYANGTWQAYGCDDTYGDGLYFSGLRVNCQGDANSRARDREPVYGYAIEYRDVYSMDLRKVRRMAKTLEMIERKLEKLSASRGYTRSYGDYLGRVAEVLGCAGIAFHRSEKSQEMSGQRWDWMPIGDGVNRANHLVYLWTQEGKTADVAS